MRVIFRVVLTAFLAIAPLSAGSAADSNQSCDGQPLVVLVFDRNCKVWCGQVRPVMKQVRCDYSGKNVQFVELDTTESMLADSRKRAKELGISTYLADAADYVPVVLVFDAKHKLTKQLPGPKTKADYEAAIEKVVLAKK
jgi:thioredoxin-related protein